MYRQQDEHQELYTKFYKGLLSMLLQLTFSIVCVTHQIWFFQAEVEKSKKYFAAATSYLSCSHSAFQLMALLVWKMFVLLRGWQVTYHLVGIWATMSSVP